MWIVINFILQIGMLQLYVGERCFFMHATSLFYSSKFYTVIFSKSQNCPQDDDVCLSMRERQCTNDNYSCSPASSPGWSEVQRVRLSRSNCMMRVLSLYESSGSESSWAIASSNACLAKWHALVGLFWIS